MSNKTLILDNTKITQKINRIAYQIYENYYKEEDIVIAGIDENGYILAKRICILLKEISPLQIKLSRLKLNKTNPLSEKVECELTEKDVENKVVIVVDDVLDSGRTLMYGVNYFLNYNVKHIRTVVLVDRSHKIFPIKADYVGLTLATTLKELIRVELDNQKDAVFLI
jgi:pyrimidine operon attenuation protein / uracil phosphoribosyltransferase